MKPQASHSSRQTAASRTTRRAPLHAILLATSALASAALSTTAVRAADGDATWLATQPDDGDKGNFNNVSHWDSTVPTGTATFNASSSQQITFGQDTTLGAISATSGAGDYRFDVGATTLTFTGLGIVVADGASVTLVASDFSSGIIFRNNSSAGRATISLLEGGLSFNDSSTAGQAKIENDGSSTLSFNDTSSAGSSSIVNNSPRLFLTTAAPRPPPALSIATFCLSMT